jgi:hypothetical protein
MRDKVLEIVMAFLGQEGLNNKFKQILFENNIEDK